eukprot:SRR837773.17564.p1 GENE.SRR837773.17564~~SRR837773.17564.p1  ORF type:complete len:413 (-),score=149.19 SRR837773.17564:40-1230(-)
MGFLSKAVCLAGLLALAARAADVTDEAAAEALRVDAECGLGDGACAFNALQLRGAAIEGAEAAEEAAAEEADAGESATRRRKSKTQDLSIAWEKKIYAWLVYIHKNVSMLDWKMYYLTMDMNSTNNTIFGTPGIKHVNGTRVNWMNHPATWVPTFALLEEAPFPSLAELRGAALLEAGEAEAVDEVEEDGATRRRKASMKGVPPRKKKMQTMMSAEQDRINKMWKEITTAKRRLNWIGNYMGAHRRLYHGRPVLVQRAEAMAHERILESSRWSDGEDFSSTPEPQAELVEQIQSCLNQTQDLWVQLGKLGGMVEAMKHRVHRYMKGKLVNGLLQENVEVAWSHGGYDGYEVAVAAVCRGRAARRGGREPRAAAGCRGCARVPDRHGRRRSTNGGVG